MQVVHGWWDRGLVLWAEDQARSRSQAPAPTAVREHPFAVGAPGLAAIVEPVPGRPVAAMYEVLLPTLDGVPVPSPDPAGAHPAGGDPVGEDPAGGMTMLGWRVPVLRLSVTQSLVGLLAGFADGVRLGPGPRHFAQVAAVADDLASRGRVLPTVRPNPQGPAGRALAWWSPVLTGTDDARVRALLASLPPSARGPRGRPTDAVAVALDGLTDAAVRRRLQRRPAGQQRSHLLGPAAAVPGLTSLLDWCAALIAPDPRFEVTEADLAALTQELSGWQTEAAGGRVRARFRLVEPDPPDAGTGRWRVEFGLQAADDPSRGVDAAWIWRSGGTEAGLAGLGDSPQEILLSELGRALRLYPPLQPALRTGQPAQLELDTAGADHFLREGAPVLAAAGFGVLLPAWWGGPRPRIGARLVPAPAQPAAVSGPARIGRESLLDFQWQLALGDQSLTAAELSALVEVHQPLVRLRGQWVQVDPNRLRAGLKLLRENPSGQLQSGDLVRMVGSGQGPGGLPVTGMPTDSWLDDLLSGTAADRIEPVAAPPGFVGALRPYQQRGLAWLSFLQRLGLGGLLADDMGLGKTVQLLALMAADDPDDGSGPSLLVCPMSLVGNWQREAARFTPRLRVHVHHGAERPRGPAFEAAVMASDLVLTTYALAARDGEALAAVRWRRVVLDEAQAVKNAATKAAVAVRGIPAGHRIAVTGTPVENRLADLWSLMDFANPGLLGSAGTFRRRFALPVEQHHDPDAAHRLRAVTQPFILRRVKTDRAIIADLPEKLEMEVVCTLTGEQASLYQAVVDDMLARVEQTEGMQRRGMVLATMVKLKQVCNHPVQLLRDGSRLDGRSGKLARLEEILEEVLDAGEKALLFTQFTQFGHLLQAHLSARFAREVLFLHGGVGQAERDAMVVRFQSAEPDVPAVLVLSLKAGGTGLTLTAANHVMHVDRWWNPAVEDQATDRVFRIGQTRDVQVRKFVCGGTLEEKISAMIRDKRGLAASIVGTGESWLTDLSTDQLRELIRLEVGAAVE